jgi:hypothetical protein
MQVLAYPSGPLATNTVPHSARSSSQSRFLCSRIPYHKSNASSTQPARF